MFLRSFRRLLYTTSLTRIRADLAAARETKWELDRELDNLIDMRWWVREDLYDEADETRQRIKALTEERDYVESKLAALDTTTTPR